MLLTIGVFFFVNFFEHSKYKHWARVQFEGNDSALRFMLANIVRSIQFLIFTVFKIFDQSCGDRREIAIISKF